MKGEWVRESKNGMTVVFVHGILSSAETCWKHENGIYWFKLLEQNAELQETGIYTFSYNTGIFSGSYSLNDVVDALKEHLRLDEVLKQNQRLIFVCHSMGGIVVRKFIVERQAELMELDIKIGLFLVASPSLGSDYANLINGFAKILGNSQADALRFHQNNIWLNGLDKEFINLKEAHRLEIIGKELIEDKAIVLNKFLHKQIVEPFSGARYFGEHYKVPNSDHSSIAKPENEDAVQHRLLVVFLKNFISDKLSPTKEDEVEGRTIIFNVPIPRNPFFTGRSNILAKLHEALQSQNEIAIKSKPSDKQPEKAAALNGLGGVGKTQTVVEYAHRYQTDYSAVLWVGADGKDLLRGNFADLSKVLGFKAEKQDDQILAVQSWLRNNDGWLLIFDNAETLELLTAAKELLPTNAQGHVLFTTRAQALGGLDSVTVDCFDDETGAVFLLRRSNPKQLRDLATVETIKPCVTENNWKTAIELVHELGGLALAIDQAGAYIEQTDCGLEGYLSRYRNDAVKLLNDRGYVHSADHPEAVYKTFLLAAENAKSRSELAYDILLDSALLHPDGISEKLYADCNPLDLDKALAALKDYSLIQRVQEGQKKFFTVHRLVQVVIRAVYNGV